MWNLRSRSFPWILGTILLNGPTQEEGHGNSHKVLQLTEWMLDLNFKGPPKWMAVYRTEPPPLGATVCAWTVSELDSVVEDRVHCS